MKLKKKLYRVTSENKATLAANNPIDVHPKHREMPGLKLRNTNYFQAMATWDPLKDLVRGRMDRHLNWSRLNDISSYISAFDSLGKLRSVVFRNH